MTPPPFGPLALAKAILQWVEAPTPQLARQIEQAIRRHRQSYYIKGVVHIAYYPPGNGVKEQVVFRRLGEGLMFP